ncbi:MAG TPA: hypothetical protein VII73_11420 [Caulobacteraceae bacterium]
MPHILPIVASLAVLGLCACQKQIEAPTDRGVCWHMAVAPGGAIKFNKLAENQPDLEHCAAQIEAMRVRFLGLGSGQTEVTGAYQGQFLFLQPEGAFTSQTFDGHHYPFLVRTGDGRLAVPGAMPAGPG